MNIIGLNTLVFGVDDLEGCARFLTDYGLDGTLSGASGRFEALDGTAVEIFRTDDPGLPTAHPPGCSLRKTVLGVADVATLAAVEAELSRDREVRRLPDGSIESVDDAGFVIGFQVLVRRPVTAVPEIVNAPGAPFQRPANQLGVHADAPRIRARSLSHIVYFVPDLEKAESFYVNRLGFRCVDRFTGVGPFLQPGGSLEHHSHFLIGAPAHMQGVEHFTFHFGGPTEVMQNGSRFKDMGYQPFWGPGRHILGSNWFWYFNSPFGCHIEMDADMDLHDASWRPRDMPLGADHSQAFLMQAREKWMPGPDSAETGAYA